MTIDYKPLSTTADCCVASIEAALNQIGDVAKHVSSDVYVSDRWSEAQIQALRTDLQGNNSLANRVRIDRNLRPFEWYVECAGELVGSNPAS